MRGCEQMKRCDTPIIFDATHSVQHPGGQGQSSGGDRTMVEPLSMSAVAQSIAGVFLEVHDDPNNAPSDGPNALHLGDFSKLVEKLRDLDQFVKRD